MVLQILRCQQQLQRCYKYYDASSMLQRCYKYYDASSMLQRCYRYYDASSMLQRHYKICYDASSKGATNTLY